jgi:hypothetical protein
MRKPFIVTSTYRWFVTGSSRLFRKWQENDKKQRPGGGKSRAGMVGNSPGGAA